ncbi:SUR7/PalI family-domain-containing protein [Coniochaeta sp. 2T2.1]|nr:SUR7/PalI family-domain-containing protein [Coniochaeta sp. 2T2.1]
MARNQPILNFLPYIFSLLSFVLVLLILLPGTNNSLSSLYYLKTDTSSLSVPAKLSSSTFLADLSAVSGADLTGSPATASSLGLADSYNLLLLTSCAHFAGGDVACEKPRVGFGFDPASNLKLDSTSLQGTFPPALLSALSSYHRISGFLGGAYIVSAVLVALSPIAGFLAARSRAAGLAAAVLSSLASILLFGAAVAAVVVFRGLNTQINSAFASSGILSEVGVAPVALGFVAFVFTLLTAVIFSIRARNGGSVSPRGRVIARNIGGTEYDAKGGPPGGPDQVGGDGPKPGLWKRIPTWSKHQYVQVEKQPALLKTNTMGARSLEAVVVTSPAGTRTRADGDEDDWAASVEDEFDSGVTGGGGARAQQQKGIPMLSLGGNKRERDVNTAYEPYSSGARGDV